MPNFIKSGGAVVEIWQFNGFQNGDRLPSRIFEFFYLAMLCMRGTSHGPVSVCVSLSVTNLSSTKTAKHKITLTEQHYSSGTLVFRHQRSPRNSTGITHYEGAE